MGSGVHENPPGASTNACSVARGTPAGKRRLTCDCPRSVREHLAGIHDVVRIERQLQLAHHGHRVAVLGAGVDSVIIALALVFWTQYARVVRAATLAEREKAYVEAARAIGAGDRHILFRHILPNIVSPVVILATLGPHDFCGEMGLFDD